MRHRNRFIAGLVCVACFFSTVPLSARRVVPFSSDREITILTWNTYIGADLIGALDPSLSQEELLTAFAQLWAQVQLTDFAQRAEAIAEQIELIHPDILCLQELALWRTGPIQNPDPATTVAYDFLAILLQAFESRGLNYEVAVLAQGSDVEVPNVATLQDLRLTDRQAILVRSDLRTSQLQWSFAQAGTYEARIPLELFGFQASVIRTWLSLDVKVRGRSFRVVATQLDFYDATVQVAQALELLSGPANTELPVLILGDLNSPADGDGTPTYNLMLQAGFVDAWNQITLEDGFTCCQEGNLLNTASTLSERIDLVLFRGNFTPVIVDVVGEEQADRTLTGLWPSDHAGVAAMLLFRKLE